jgi:adenine-specific DNA methylase
LKKKMKEKEVVSVWTGEGLVGRLLVAHGKHIIINFLFFQCSYTAYER